MIVVVHYGNDSSCSLPPGVISLISLISLICLICLICLSGLIGRGEHSEPFKTKNTIRHERPARIWGIVVRGSPLEHSEERLSDERTK